MPIARYFVLVGSALAVLLVFAGWILPERLPSCSDRSDIIERVAIRIKSERKWPERVILDVNQPTFSPPTMEWAPAREWAEPPPDEMTDHTGVDALDKPKPDAQLIDTNLRPVRDKRKLAKKLLSNRVAKSRNRREQARSGRHEACCRAGWRDRPAVLVTASRGCAARRASWVDWNFPKAN